jgi:hypothetical protein
LLIKGGGKWLVGMVEGLYLEVGPSDMPNVQIQVTMPSKRVDHQLELSITNITFFW